MKYSDKFKFGSGQVLPISVTYEYKLNDNIASVLFEDFDLLQLKPSEFDMQACDGDSWHMKIYTDGVNV